MLTRAQKQEQVESLREKVGRAAGLVLVDYRGLTVDESNELRAAFRKAGEGQIEYRVAKNTLLRRAAEGTPFEGINAYLTGPTAVAISYEEPATMAKALVDFAKDNEKLEIKGGAMDGEVIDLVAIQALAKLPTKHELQGTLLMISPPHWVILSTST